MTQWCTYNEEGREWCNPRQPYRIGRFLRNRGPSKYSNYPGCAVRWIGCKCESNFARSFIHIFSDEPEYKGILPKIRFWKFLASERWAIR